MSRDQCLHSFRKLNRSNFKCCACCCNWFYFCCLCRKQTNAIARLRAQRLLLSPSFRAWALESTERWLYVLLNHTFIPTVLLAQRKQVSCPHPLVVVAAFFCNTQIFECVAYFICQFIVSRGYCAKTLARSLVGLHRFWMERGVLFVLLAWFARSHNHSYVHCALGGEIRWSPNLFHKLFTQWFEELRICTIELPARNFETNRPAMHVFLRELFWRKAPTNIWRSLQTGRILQTHCYCEVSQWMRAIRARFQLPSRRGTWTRV